MTEAHLQLLATTAALGLVGSGMGLLLLYRRLWAEKRRTQTLEAQTATKESDNAQLRAENERLLPYGRVADADAEAKHLLEEAHVEARKIADELAMKVAAAEKELDDARSQAQQVIQLAIIEATAIAAKAKSNSE